MFPQTPNATSMTSGATPSEVASHTASTDERALLGAALAAIGRRDYRSALNLAEQVLADNPRSARAVHVLGLVALAFDEPSRAIAMFEQAHELDHESHEHAEMLAILYAKVGMLSDSLYYGKVATVLPPDPILSAMIPTDIGSFADNLLAIREKPLSVDGGAAASRGDYERAARMFEQALDLEPMNIDAWRGLAQARLAADHPFEALIAFLSLRQIAIDDTGDLVGLAHCLTALGRFADAQACHAAIAAQAPNRADFAAAHIADQLSTPGIGPAEITTATRRWAGMVTPRRSLPTATPRPLEGRPLRIGVVGSRFRDGAEFEPLMRILAAHDPKSCQVYVYSANPYEDSRTRRFRNGITRWTNIARTDDDTAALLIRNDAPDLLIDTDGFAPGGRPGLFFRRPAAKQAALLESASTAAARGIDFVIGDAWTHPEDEPETAGVTVVRVAGGLFEIPAATSTRQAPEDDQLVFGTLATRRQLSLDLVATWAGALRQLPNARLILDRNRLGGVEGVREVTNQFAYFGVADRLSEVEAEEGSTTAEMLIPAIDVLLEPFRQPSIVSTAAAISAGIPVVALLGPFPVDRRAASLLAFAGRAGSVARDAAEYQAMMVEAGNPGLGIAPPTPRPAGEIAASLEAAYRTLLG